MFRVIKFSLLLLFIVPFLSYGQTKKCFKQEFEKIDYNCASSVFEAVFTARQKKFVEDKLGELTGIDFKGKSIEEARTFFVEKASTVENKEKKQKLEKVVEVIDVFQSTVLSLTNKASAKKLKNQIFFYKTSNGFYGKMIIRNASKTPLSCSVYVDTVTWEGKNLVKKSITFVTESVSSSWNVDRASFDNKPGSDFLIRRESGRCRLKRVKGQMVKVATFKAPEEVDDNEILMYAALFLIGLAVFLVARTVFQDEDRFKAQEKLEDAEQDGKEESPNDIVLKYSTPFFKRYFSPIVAGMKSKRKIKEKYKRPLASSGMNKFLTPEDFYAFKLFLIIGFPIVYLGLRAFLEEDWPLIYTPLLSIVGFFYPDIWIKGKIDARRTNVIENMPFIVDMLALSVEAGLDFVAAMQKVIEKAPPSALVEEFETLIKETKVGASRAEGLRQMAWRIDSLPVSSFCATLIAADSVGANIGPILKTLAQELREKRSAMAEQKGAQAATKILIPMIFLVLPAVLLIIAAPIGLQLMGR